MLCRDVQTDLAPSLGHQITERKDRGRPQSCAKAGQFNFMVLLHSSFIHDPAQDPDGAYIAKWVPELARLPRKWLHQPWLAPSDVLETAGVKFGAGNDCYPQRITTAVPQVRRDHSGFTSTAFWVSLAVSVSTCTTALSVRHLLNWSASVAVLDQRCHDSCIFVVRRSCGERMPRRLRMRERQRRSGLTRVDMTWWWCLKGQQLSRVAARCGCSPKVTTGSSSAQREHLNFLESSAIRNQCNVKTGRVPNGGFTRPYSPTTVTVHVHDVSTIKLAWH